MDLGIADHITLVLGGTGLIGSAVAATARAEGAIVVTAARSAGADLQLDANDDRSVALAVDRVLEMHGRVDALVVAAAPAAQTLDPARANDPAQVARAVDEKAMTFLRVANAVIPSMRAAGSGRIVGVSGQNALLTGNITGAVRNAALIIAAESLADDLAGSGIAVNVVNPGTVTASATTEVAPGKPGESTPQQVADLIVMLLSPRLAVSSESIASGHRVRGAVIL